LIFSIRYSVIPYSVIPYSVFCIQYSVIQ
jgi:hypothetical protein